MWRKLICLLLVAFCVENVLTKSTRRHENRKKGMTPTYVGTAYDYDYAPPLTRKAASWRYPSTTTTERPIVRYWNNFVRNVRLPIPSITWNMTNPLVNLFNNAGTNVLETPVGEYYTDPPRRRKNHSHSQGNIVVKRTRKRKPRPQRNHKVPQNKQKPQQVADEEEQQTGDINLEPYTYEFDPNKAVYFYDPSAGQYYEMQRLYSQYMTENYEDQNTATEAPKADDNEDNENEQMESAENSEIKQVAPANGDNDDDDEVSVVSKLEDEEGDEEKSAQETAAKKNEQSRNVMGGYIAENGQNKRKRVKAKRKTPKRGGSKPRKQNSIRYYFLQGV